MTKYRDISPVQYLKMFDPSNKGPDKREKNEESGNIDDEGDKSETDNTPEQDKDSSEFEKAKRKYGPDVKFHCLIKQNGDIGDVLPNFMCIQNPLPGEPKFFLKRRIPKSLRF